MLLLWTQETGLVRRGLAVQFDFFKQNLLRASEDFSDSAWEAATVTVVPDASTAPNGQSSADQAEPAGVDSFLRQQVGVVHDQDYTFSVYLRSPGGSVDLEVAIYDEALAVLAAAPAAVSGSWQRFQVTANSLTNDNLFVSIGGNSSWESGEDVFCWGAQVNEGAVAAAYEFTENEQAVRDSGAHGNELTLGAESDPDASDPVWRQHRLRFDGSSFARRAITQGLPAGNADLTLTIAAKMTALTATHVLMAYGSDDAGETPHLQVTNTDLLRAGFLGAGNIASTSSPIGSLDGYFVGTLRYRASDLLLECILNDFEDAGSTLLSSPPNATNEKLVVGSRFGGANGAPAEVAFALVYERRLSDQELLRNHRAIRSLLLGRGVLPA